MKLDKLISFIYIAPLSLNYCKRECIAYRNENCKQGTDFLSNTKEDNFEMLSGVHVWCSSKRLCTFNRVICNNLYCFIINLYKIIQFQMVIIFALNKILAFACFHRVFIILLCFLFPLSEQGNAGLEKFFRYATSLDRIPALGLSRKVEVEFSTNRNPAFFAETCNMVLKVPTVHECFENFQEKFIQACENYIGYGSI